MKKFLLAIVVLLLCGGLVWLVWFKAPAEEEAEQALETEVPVRVGEVTRATVRGFITAYGAVEPEPAGERPAASALVAAAVQGVIEAVHCREGQHVDQGALLFQLDSRAADAAVEKAQRAAEFAELAMNRQKKLLELAGTSQRSLQETEALLAAARGELIGAQAQQSLLRVTAPLPGTVVRINARRGEAVDMTKPLAELIDLDRLVVGAAVPTTQLSSLRMGAAVEVLTEGAKPIAGSLAFISPRVEAGAGVVQVQIALPRQSGLRPGQFVTTRIVTEEHTNRLVAPVESVVKDEEGRLVIAIVENNKATRKEVKVGLREGGLVEVEAEGLEAGMAVVKEGAYALPEETAVRVVKD